MTPSRPPLNELHAFATVARLRSFRRAADALGVSASALSHGLRALEERLGLRLLQRSTRSVVPTEVGEQLLLSLEPALRQIGDALHTLDETRESPRGTLRINAPRAACDLVLAPLLAPYLAAYPEMRVELVGDDRPVDIVAEGFDAGVRFGESLRPDVVAVPIGPRQRFVVVGSPAYLDAWGRPRHPRELAAHRCVRLRFPGGTEYRWQFEQAAPAGGTQRMDVAVDGPLSLGDMRLMASAAEQGLGLAYVYLPYAQPALDAGRLHTVLDDWRPAEAGFYLYHPSRRQVPAGLRAFIDMARTQPQVAES